MADDWDSEDFVPAAPKNVIKDSWDDEEDVEVKESWEDDDVKPTPAAAPAKSKPAEKKKPAEVSKPVEVNVSEMTEEEKKRAQEKIDLGHAAELFGLNKSLDQISLNTREESIDYSNRLYSRLNEFHNKPYYQEFLEELFKSLCKNLPADTVRKISNSFKAFSDTKTSQEKAAKQADSKAKGKIKPKIKSEKDAIKGDINDFLKVSNTGNSAGFNDDYEDEDEDFM